MPFPDDTLAYWQLDESTSPPDNKYVDTFDGNDGTGTAGLVAGTGTVSGAQDFNGTDTKIEVDADRFFDWAAGDSFSIEAWVKTDGVAPNVLPAHHQPDRPGRCKSLAVVDRHQ